MDNGLLIELSLTFAAHVAIIFQTHVFAQGQIRTIAIAMRFLEGRGECRGSSIVISSSRMPGTFSLKTSWMCISLLCGRPRN